MCLLTFSLQNNGFPMCLLTFHLVFFLGASLAAYGTSWEPFWELLATFWSPLGAFGGLLWSYLVSFAPLWGALDEILEPLGDLWDSTWPFQLASKRNLDSTGPLQFASKYQLDSTWPFQLASQRHLDSTATASFAIGVLSHSPSSAVQVYSNCAPVGIPQGLPLPTQLLLYYPKGC